MFIEHFLSLVSLFLVSNHFGCFKVECFVFVQFNAISAFIYVVHSILWGAQLGFHPTQKFTIIVITIRTLISSVFMCVGCVFCTIQCHSNCVNSWLLFKRKFAHIGISSHIHVHAKQPKDIKRNPIFYIWSKFFLLSLSRKWIVDPERRLTDLCWIRERENRRI